MTMGSDPVSLSDPSGLYTVVEWMGGSVSHLISSLLFSFFPPHSCLHLFIIPLPSVKKRKSEEGEEWNEASGGEEEEEEEREEEWRRRGREKEEGGRREERRGREEEYSISALCGSQSSLAVTFGKETGIWPCGLVVPLLFGLCALPCEKACALENITILLVCRLVCSLVLCGHVLYFSSGGETGGGGGGRGKKRRTGSGGGLDGGLAVLVWPCGRRVSLRATCQPFCVPCVAFWPCGLALWLLPLWPCPLFLLQWRQAQPGNSGKTNDCGLQCGLVPHLCVLCCSLLICALWPPDPSRPATFSCGGDFDYLFYSFDCPYLPLFSLHALVDPIVSSK